MRQHNTLVDAMDKALRVEVDLAPPGHAMVTSAEKNKWDGLSKSLKKQKGHQDRTGDKPD